MSDDKKPMKIVVKRDLCIGAAPCVAVAPNTYVLDEEMKAVIKKKYEDGIRGEEASEGDMTFTTDDEQTVIMSAEACPVRAIFLYDGDGNQVYPRD